jgi:two-component system OmpR family response regulator
VRILVVEDEVRLARSIKRGLESQPSFAVDICHDGEDGEHLALTNNYDAVILDIMLPGKSGLEILQSLRAAGRESVVLILTARAAKEDVVLGLDLGSDDYLAKPFDMGELIARIKALVRRAHGRAAPLLRVEDLEIDTRRHLARRAGREILLPALEYRLLEYLAFRAGEIVSKTDLLEHLYDYNWEKFSNVIEVYISSLRRKLESAELPKLIHTIRGQGYLLGRRDEEPERA